VKIVLTYDGHEELQDATRAMQSLDLALCLWDVNQELRRRYKYSEDGAEIKFAEEMRDKFFSILEDHNVVMENIIS